MKKEDFQQDILHLIHQKGNVTFAELERDLPSFTYQTESDQKDDATYVWRNAEFPSWHLWLFKSAEAVQWFNDLSKNYVIEMKSTDALLYVMDGTTLNLPLVEEAKNYEEDRWLPVTIGKGENFNKVYQPKTMAAI